MQKVFSHGRWPLHFCSLTFLASASIFAGNGWPLNFTTWGLLISGGALGVLLEIFPRHKTVSTAETVGHFSDLLSYCVQELDDAICSWQRGEAHTAIAGIKICQGAILRLIAGGMQACAPTVEGNIYANIMIPNEKDQLEIMSYGGSQHRRPSRNDKPLPLNKGLRGAPQAFNTGRQDYISDTRNINLGGIFKDYSGKPDDFRAVLSIPLVTGDKKFGNPIGVLNIDAEHCDAFPEDTQRDFIELTKPWCSLLSVSISIAKAINDDRERNAIKNSTPKA